MAANNNRFRSFSGQLLVGALGMCALLALAVFAVSPARSGAQSEPAQKATQQSTPAPAQPAPDAPSTPAPAQQDATATPAQPAAQPASDAAPTQPRAPYPGMTPEDKRKQQVSQECADLLKLATDLKAQVDKARKDELSVTVVRKAAELEQMAHKIKSGTALTASNN
jgi:cytoskeletal protein RodZ